ncbi:Rieske (2Fe-2S) protein [Kineosporiaceae bacterium SCSIO 59966]|jgi:Rieske Fe-S protein|nr:Rieske (2Fe-2S) protein [Kineosporiaceae bacterium SCSIO 59966]
MIPVVRYVNRPCAPSRRAVVLAGAAGVASLTTACSGDDEPTTNVAAGDVVAQVSDVPVGGAVSATGPSGPLLIAQPTEGQVVAFSAVCTHQGCTVAPGDGDLRCPCHGSVFDLATGTNVSGPAPAPLAAAQVEVVDGQIRAL